MPEDFPRVPDKINKLGILVPGGNVYIDKFDNSQNSQRPPKPPKYIPHKGVDHFVGRRWELTTLHKRLQQPRAVAISAVAGMGGVGKTELATQYARRYEADYPGGICWLNARGTNLAAEIVQFYQLYVDTQQEVPQELGGRRLSIKEQASWCWEKWEPSSGLVLVVLDDVTDLGNCGEVLPRDNRFNVLITTRLRNLDPNIVEEIRLDVLSPEESLQLLTALVGEKRIQRERQAAIDLCEWLGYLPLGLQLVGCYLANDPDLSLVEMWQQLQDQGLQNEALNPSQWKTLSTSQQGILAAFELSWQKLDLMTQHVAELLSLFAPDVIPWNLVEFVTQRLNWSEVDVNEAKKQVYKRNFIQPVEELTPLSQEVTSSPESERVTPLDSPPLIPNQGEKSWKPGYYKIHPLIWDFLQVKLADLAEEDKHRGLFAWLCKLLHRTITANDLKWTFAAAMVDIAREIPQTPTLEDIDRVKYAIPHLSEVAQNLTVAMSDEDLIRVFKGLGWFYQGQGLYTLAELWLEQCVSVVQTRLGEEHPHVATSYNNLANLYSDQGRYMEAEPLYQKALSLRQRLLREDHPHVATSYNNLAELYRDQGRYMEAEPLYQKALSLRQRLLGEDHPHVAQIYNNLANLYLYQGRYTEAEPLYQKALSLMQRLLREDHPHVANSYNNLAGLYYSQGRYTEAEPLYQKALSLRQRLLGEDHPHVAQSYNNLAELYSAQGRYREAKPLYQQALSLRQRLLGEDHPAVATSYNDLARLYYSLGRYKEAEPLYQRALSLRQRLLGEDHPHVAQSYNNLAELYSAQGRYREAAPLYQQALSLRQRLLGEDHPAVATSYNDLAELYSAQGRYREAEPLYQKALSIRQRLLGEDHPAVATSYNDLAKLYYFLGRYTEAEPLYQKALEICERQLGVDHPKTMEVKENYEDFLREAHS